MSVSTILVLVCLAVCKVQSTCVSYPVALDTLGPRPCPLPPIATVQSTPVIEKPVIRLPALVPCPRTISNKCRCMKTIVKPQVYHQLINVPTIQRYIEISHRPVVEKIHYTAHPVNVGCRDACGNVAYYDDGEYADCSGCCRRNLCAVAYRPTIPCRRTYPIGVRCYEPCVC